MPKITPENTQRIPKPPWRNLRRAWHLIKQSRQVRLDGVLLCTDRKLVPRSIQRALYRGTYEYAERLLLHRILRPEHRVLDLGGCIGMMSLVAARLVGADRVLCYEANPAMEPVIRKNFALNDMEPGLEMKAVTTDGGEVTLFASANPLASSLRTEVSGERVQVPSDPIGDILARHRPDVLVMDVEGAEVDLLPGAPLDDIEYLLLEVHDQIVGAERVEKLLAELKKKGFERLAGIQRCHLFGRAGD